MKLKRRSPVLESLPTAYAMSTVKSARPVKLAGAEVTGAVVTGANVTFVLLVAEVALMVTVALEAVVGAVVLLVASAATVRAAMGLGLLVVDCGAGVVLRTEELVAVVLTEESVAAGAVVVVVVVVGAAVVDKVGGAAVVGGTYATVVTETLSRGRRTIRTG